MFYHPKGTLITFLLASADQALAMGAIELAIETFKAALREANRAKMRRCAGYIIVAIRCCRQAQKV